MKPSVCFVALKSYAVLSDEPSVRHIGGAEVQQSLLARELVRRGYPVRFVVLDHGQADGIGVDGIRVFKAYSPAAGIPVLRFFYPKLARLWSAMARADADVYYQRGAGVETGLVACWARRHGRRFVFAAASDSNCDADLPMLSRSTDRVLFRYGIRNADAIIVQSQRQQSLFRDRHSERVHRIPSGFAPPSERELCGPELKGARPRVLWIGRLHAEKRPEWVLDLARDVPAFDFDIVGGCNADSAYGQAIIHRAASIPNVVHRGYMPHAEVLGFYRESTLLLCTSPAEGFPNVFLEAWARGIPVLSTVDPDGLIAREGLGRVCEDYDGLRRALCEAPHSVSHWRDCGLRAREYVRKNHDITVVGAMFAKVLDQVTCTQAHCARPVAAAAGR